MTESSFQNFEDYKRQMESGAIQKAYKGIIEYTMHLRTHFKNNYPEYFIGSFYQGYMDMTYFPVIPNILKDKKLKLAIVFDHLKFQFEIWLSGQNRNIQNEYLKLIKKKVVDENYIITENPDSIIEMVVIENPDFKELNKITAEIETCIMKFTTDIKDILL